MAIFKRVGHGSAKRKRYLRTLNDWRDCAGPKSVSKQWVDGYSAKECARAWLETPSRMPLEIESLLATNRAFGTVTGWEGEPEATLAFDEYSGPRKTDLLVEAHDEHGALHLAVEAKVRESFGETVARALAAALLVREDKPESNAVRRIVALARSYFGSEPTELDVSTLRYQLLTATAGAVRHALDRGVGRTVLLVHEFVREPSTHSAYETNKKDLDEFIARLTRGCVVEVPPGRLVEVPLPAGIITGGTPLRFFVGKASRPVETVAAAPNNASDDDSTERSSLSISSEGSTPMRWPPLTFPLTNRVGGTPPPPDWDWTKGPFPTE
jgi:hypothetical protein